ncbi:MAG: hypothetical protein GX187_03525 [Clostridiaceae bacterium]|nr:hypothetical protein [Clostridiaceae bacterium]
MSRSTKYSCQHIVKLKDIIGGIFCKMYCFTFILLLLLVIAGLSACTGGSVTDSVSVTEPSFGQQNIGTEVGFDHNTEETNTGEVSGTVSENSETDQSEFNVDYVTEPAPSSGPEPTPVPKPTPAPSPEPYQDSASKPIDVSGIVNPYVPYTYDQMIAESQKLFEKYPEIIALDSIGSSVEGRELLLIKMGTGEKKIILCGSHHAREYITSSYLMKMIEEYARVYSSGSKFGNYDVKNLLDQVTLYVVPMVNPDGVNLVNNGLDSVADKEAVQTMALVKPNYREWKANINGVDLNRQYPAHWEEKYDNVGVPASENYKGTAPATEPEVQAMMKLTEENDFILAASFHTKGNCIFWADEGTVDKIPGVEAMAKRLAALTKYEVLPVSKKPSVYGAGYENWFRMKFNRPAFCIELTPHNKTDLPHDDKKFDSLVWNNAKYIGLFLADEALKR